MLSDVRTLTALLSSNVFETGLLTARKNLKSYRIAVIEGDGIGHEVVPEGIRVLEAAARRFELSFSWQHFEWSCETYLKTGRMMPEDGLEQLRPFDAIYLGAIGYPGVPDHVSLWGLLIPIRRGFKEWVVCVLRGFCRALPVPSAGASLETSTS